MPGPRGPQGASGSSLNNITQSADVDATAVANGSILQYRSSDGKWVARNSFDTTAGVTFVLSGGSF